AKSWKVSADGRHFTLTLRRGIRFSDGQPFDADDVVFTFQALLDESVHAPQRDLLTINGKPIQVRKSGPYTVEVDLPEPDADAEVLRFRAGEIDVLSPLSADNFAALSDGSHPEYQLHDLGPGLEYNFLFFNLNDLPPGGSGEMQKISKEQAWFRNVRFRRAIS